MAAVAVSPGPGVAGAPNEPVSTAPKSRGGQRIGEAFRAASADGRAALIPYAVAGFPDAAGAQAVALSLIDSGADLLEVGLPYSDPLADGATVQRAGRVALGAGATLEHSVALIERIAKARPGVPLVAMGYVNQVLGGRDGGAVLRRLGAAGVCGMILTDLTPDEGAELEADAAAQDMAIVYLVAPTSTPDRRAGIASRSGGFLYAVSLAGVTGARSSLPSGIGRFLRDVRAVSPVPVAVGFGVSRPEHARRLAPLADGIVVGSALVDALGPEGTDLPRMTTLVRSLRDATKR